MLHQPNEKNPGEPAGVLMRLELNLRSYRVRTQELEAFDHSY